MTNVVMLIEDDRLHQKLFAIWLERDGYVVHTVRDERLAYVEALQIKPAVAVIDIRLPYIDGRRIIRSLKSGAQTNLIPVIAWTVLGDRADETSCYDAGADYFISKAKGRKPLIGAITSSTANGAALSPQAIYR